jgi:hypothetical protein
MKDGLIPFDFSDTTNAVEELAIVLCTSTCSLKGTPVSA